MYVWQVSLYIIISNKNVYMRTNPDKRSYEFPKHNIREKKKTRTRKEEKKTRERAREDFASNTRPRIFRGGFIVR